MKRFLALEYPRQKKLFEPIEPMGPHESVSLAVELLILQLDLEAPMCFHSAEELVHDHASTGSSAFVSRGFDE